MTETLPRNDIEIPAILQEMVACAKSDLGLDMVQRRLDDILDSCPQIDKFHLGCHITSLISSYHHHPDLQDRMAYIKILLWIRGNSPISNRSPFASILHGAIETTLAKYEPLLDTQDYNFLQSLLLSTTNTPNLQDSEDFELPEYLLSPVIPLTSHQQAREAKYWRVPKATSTTNITDMPAVPLHYLEPPFFRPSPLISQYLLPFLSSGAMLDGTSESDAAHTSTKTSDTTKAITKVEELSAAAQDIMRSEFIWLNPEYPLLQFQRFQLDDDDFLEVDSNDHVVGGKKPVTYLEPSITELFESKAYISPLLPHEEQAILKAIRGISNSSNNSPREKFLNKSQFLQECKLDPQTLPMLVENNHNIAIECLLQILSPSSSKGEDSDSSFGPAQENDFLSALVSMDMSLQSMEVVNFLATTPIYKSSKASSEAAVANDKVAVSDRKNKGKENKHRAVPPTESTPSQIENNDRYLLPKEFLHSFISNCISCCENIVEEKVQKRSVRLCCIFFQNLIQRKIVDVEEVQVEVQAFCIEFSRFREAIVLFKLLKEFEANND